METPRVTDVVVVGSGAAGITAALTAAIGGRSVLLVEKSDRIGGATAWSGGVAWVPLNPHMNDVDATDSRSAAETYIRAILGNRYDDAMVGAFLDNGAAMVSFLEKRSSAVRFKAFMSPDYHPDLAGAAAGARSILASPFDGRGLGPWLGRLREPLPEFTVLGGMQVDPAEALDLQYWYRSWGAMRRSLRLMSRYAADRLRHGRGTRMIRGLALAARLLRSAVDAGVEIWTQAAATGLIVTDGRVTGLMVDRDGETVRVIARHGVVLASGGFAADAQMVARHIPHAASHLTILPDTNTGDGIAMATAIGAAQGPDNAANGIWAPASARRTRSGRLSTYPHFAFDRCKPGSMMVDHDGNRFANEAQSYHTLVNTMHEHAIMPAWLIADHAFLRKYGMGLARPFPYPWRHFVREGYLIEAPAIPALAAAIGVPSANLERQVARMNRFAQTGVDEDFGRGEDVYSRMLGDASHGPNPCLGPIGRGPFYALALYATNAGTTLGLRTNARAQVLDGAGAPIAGLYAAGLDMHAALRGHYPGAGTSIGPAMTFGYIAGQQLAH